MTKIVNSMKGYRTKEDFLENSLLIWIIIISDFSINTKNNVKKQHVKKENKLFASMRNRYKIFKKRERNKDQKDLEDQKDNQKK